MPLHTYCTFWMHRCVVPGCWRCRFLCWDGGTESDNALIYLNLREFVPLLRQKCLCYKRLDHGFESPILHLEKTKGYANAHNPYKVLKDGQRFLAVLLRPAVPWQTAPHHAASDCG
jgi:hypothetical protein